MLKLMKYEIRKTWFVKLMLLGATAVAELLFLFGLYADKETALSIGILLLTFLAFGGVLVIGLESILTLHRDMNTKQSYMLFMTPNSCYSILGAKVLENGISILATGAFFFALGMLDITLMLAKLGELQELWNMVRDLLEAFDAEIAITPAGIASFLFTLLSAWIGIVTTAFLADVVSSALLNGRKYNGVLSFLLFLLLSWFTSWITQSVTRGIGTVNTKLLVQGLLSLVFAFVMYIASAQIMERKLSV